MSNVLIYERAHELLQDWLASCVRHNKLSRNTIAIGIVVLDHLREKCPLSPEDVISSGGEIRNSRSSLHRILQKYGVNQPKKYLKEVTTRQAHQDGRRLLELYQFGTFFIPLPSAERDQLLLQLIGELLKEVDIWLGRQNLKVGFERHHTPSEWIGKILEAAKSKSGGVVEQHLVGAKLQKRYPQIEVANFPGHAADKQTGRLGDFVVGTTIYHVTASPTPNVVQKCGDNIRAGLHPILLVPSEQVIKTKSIAEYERLEKQLTVMAIEDFVALNIIELATGEQSKFYVVLSEILDIYNHRLEQVETDMSLKIEAE